MPANRKEDELVPAVMLTGGQALVVMAVSLTAMVAAIIFTIYLDHRNQVHPFPVVTIIMDAKGFHPAILHVKTGQPVELRFVRREGGFCTKGVVLSDWGIDRSLKLGQSTSIVVDPLKPGSYPFHCRMGCLKGVIWAGT